MKIASNDKPSVQRSSPDCDLLNEIVKLHKQAFPNYFLTLLGNGFLKELYRAFGTREHGILLTVVHKGELAGVAAGAHLPNQFFSVLRRNRGIFFAIKALPALTSHPTLVAQKLVRAIRYSGGAPSAPGNAVLLSSIAVSPSHQNLGLGSLLLRSFEFEAAKTGASTIYLTTDATDENPAHSFYRRHGYLAGSIFMQDKTRPMNRYEKNIASENI